MVFQMMETELSVGVPPAVMVPPEDINQLYPVIPASVVYSTGTPEHTLEGPFIVGTGNWLTVIVAVPLATLMQLVVLPSCTFINSYVKTPGELVGC